jgi:predicted  nucleic acid-binding Zn-ribbon protein
MSPQEKLSQQIELLEALAIVDADIKRLDVQISEEQSQLSTLKSEQTRLDAKLGEGRSSAAEMQKTLGELVIEARQMSTQIDRSREKLSRARRSAS